MFCNCRVIGRSLASSREELGEASDSGRKMVAQYCSWRQEDDYDDHDDYVLMVMMIMIINDH